MLKNLFGLTAAVFVLVLAQSLAADEVRTVFKGRLKIALPDGYIEREPPERERSVTFALDDPSLRGSDWNPDGRRAEAHIWIFGPTDLDSAGWREKSPRQIHDEFCVSFANQWYGDTDFGFDYYDPATGVGRCVNLAGAFVFVFTRLLNDHLLMVEAMDLVEAQRLDHDGDRASQWAAFKSAPTAHDKWLFVRDAANATVIEAMMSTAVVTP